MAKFLIVTEKKSDWAAYFPSESVVSVGDYLDHRSDEEASHSNTQVINLCRDFSYQSLGYYCSLLAEARGHRILPTLRTINEVSRKEAQWMVLNGMHEALDLAFSGQEHDTISQLFYFGQSSHPALQKVARQLFEQYPLPVMQVTFRHNRHGWQVASIAPFPFQALENGQQDSFAAALERFSRKIWRQPAPHRRYRYDLALLIDREEHMPPSNLMAIKRFIRAGQKLGIRVEIIDRDQLARLGEFDALFIRATTNIDNYTYTFARRAEKLGLVVIDDPGSIMYCTNKVYLSELLEKHKVPMPKTRVIRAGEKGWVDKTVATLGLPCVLKLPDGSFSRGVHKVESVEALEQKAGEMLASSALILAQEFMYTEFDWRIGVLNRQPLFACKYYMSRGHWQIYQHKEGGQFNAGGWETLDVMAAPRCVRETALKAANLIGDGLYGVDIKQKGNRAYVIEINDNPNIDRGIEDHFMGDLIYERVMAEFLRRLQQRGL
ncbi:RimK family protein [Pseudaeromonas sharmana]|uniref:RimK family protein n=1 Tax=Pseudaeromonas sharmana TaxID=328412 RepID=A0ABV8CQ17_9GAMM